MSEDRDVVSAQEATSNTATAPADAAALTDTAPLTNDMASANTATPFTDDAPTTPVIASDETISEAAVSATEEAREEPVTAQAASPRPVSSRRPNEWSRAKESFVSILDEAGDAIRVFEQEKRRILGLTHALSQIQQSFDDLHTRFNEMEKNVSSALGERERVDQRIDATTAAVRKCRENEAELARDNAALRATVAEFDVRLTQNTEDFAALTEENRKLRERLVAMERDGGLIVDEIARIRNELITLNERGYDVEPAPLAADRRAAESPIVSQEEPAVTTRGRAAATGDLTGMVNDLTQALSQQKNDLGRLSSERAETPPLASPAAARAMSVRRLVEPLPAKDTPVVAERPSRRPIQPQQTEVVRSELGSAAAPAPEEDAASAGTSQALREAVDINALCSVFEKRSMDLRIELLRERRERQMIENALQTARTERAQLQRELARVHAKSWRSPPPPEDPFEPPLDPPEPANRDFIPAQYRRQRD
jgi:predicted  nucleic acid-binding Zn-ribbon protein